MRTSLLSGAALLLVVISLLPARAGEAEPRRIEVHRGQSLRRAVEQARPGDIVEIRAGTYVESLLNLPDGIRLVSADGPHQAVIDGAGEGDMVIILNRKDIVLDGLELRHAGQHIVKIEQSHDITLRNCKIHGAGDGDCVKVTVGSSRITIEGCEVYDPGKQGSNTYEQNIDFIDTEEAVVRGCLLYHVDGHGDQIGYFKGGSRRCLLERNVILNAGGGDNDAPAWTLGQETDGAYKRGDYECVESVARNNVFVNCSNGALGFYGCRGGYAYGNVLVNSGPPFGFHRSGNSVSPAVDKIYIINNTILNPDGKLSRFYEGFQNLDGSLKCDFNRVWNAGKRLPGDFKQDHPVSAAPEGGPEEKLEPSLGLGVILERLSPMCPEVCDLRAELPPEARVPDPPLVAPPARRMPRDRAHFAYVPVQPGAAVLDGGERIPEPVTIRDLGFLIGDLRVVMCPVREKPPVRAEPPAASPRRPTSPTGPATRSRPPRAGEPDSG